MSEGIRPGSVVYIRYRDHVLFRDADADLFKPVVREAIGWLEREDDACIRLVWERYAEPVPDAPAGTKSTGLVILKSAIKEMRKVG